jgi:hypothetical protein
MQIQNFRIFEDNKFNKKAFKPIAFGKNSVALDKLNENRFLSPISFDLYQSYFLNKTTKANNLLSFKGIEPIEIEEFEGKGNLSKTQIITMADSIEEYEKSGKGNIIKLKPGLIGNCYKINIQDKNGIIKPVAVKVAEISSELLANPTEQVQETEARMIFMRFATQFKDPTHAYYEQKYEHTSTPEPITEEQLFLIYEKTKKKLQEFKNINPSNQSNSYFDANLKMLEDIKDGSIGNNITSINKDTKSYFKPEENFAELMFENINSIAFVS